MALHVAVLAFVTVSLVVLVRSRWRPWRGRLPLAFAGFWLVVFVWAVPAYLRAPDPAAARQELTGLLTGGLLALAVFASIGGDPQRLRGARLGWTLGLALCVLTAVVEIVTGTHLWVPADQAWAIQSRTVVSGPFHNPNDFAVVLTAMISGTIAYRVDVTDGRRRLLLTALIVMGGIVVVLTESRGGLLALVAVLVMHAWRAWRTRAHVRHPGLPGAPRRVWPWVATAALAAALAVSVFPSPRTSPVARVVAGVTAEGTARSDHLRIDLVRAGLRYFEESDGLGTGAGSFEPLLAADPNPGVSTRTWLHNSFVEILLQYGLVVALLLGALVAAIAVAALQRPRGASSEQAPGASALDRTEALCALLVFVALGLDANSALETHVWWVGLAYAAACAYTIHVRTSSPAQTTLDEVAVIAAPRPVSLR